MSAFSDPSHSEKDDLTGFIDRELRRLPELEAPPELSARILNHIRHTASLPWWRRSFWEWPFRVRMAATALLLTLAVSMLWGISSFSLANTLQGLQAQKLSPIWTTMAGWATQFSHFYQHQNITFWLWIGSLSGTLLFLMLVGTTTALVRLATPKTRAT